MIYRTESELITFDQNKNFCFAKDTLEMTKKKQVQTWKKYLQTTCLTKESYL